MLSVFIDRREEKAEFSGDTFQHKELIKSCGQARWEKARKVWVVSNFTMSAAELHELLPDIQVNENASKKETATQEERTPVTGDLPDSLSVVELVQKAERAIAAAFPQRLFVHGVVSSIKSASDGRIFLTLSAEQGGSTHNVNCTIWANDVARVLKPLREKGFELEANLEVMFGVQVRFWRQRAELSLSVLSVVPEYTMAKLLAQREKTNERLKKEGLFARNKSTSLPFLPQRLGIITSSSGTVIHDFKTALDTAQFAFELLWCHAAVQGDTAATQLCAALTTLQRQEVDAILIFRGGGSASDLAVFNDYAVARAVCESKVPVFSAIGHQEDQSSVQDVSFHTEGVPQGLGRYFAQIVIDFRRQVQLSAKSIHKSVVGSMQRWSERKDSLLSTILRLARRTCDEVSEENLELMRRGLRTAARAVQAQERETFALARLFTGLAMRINTNYKNILDRFATRISDAPGRLLRYRKERLVSLQQLVAASSPEVQLKRGFAMVRKAEGTTYVVRGENLKEDEVLEVVFQDAVRKVVVR